MVDTAARLSHSGILDLLSRVSEDVTDILSNGSILTQLNEAFKLVYPLYNL